MKIVPNKIWFKIGTKFMVGNIYYEIVGSNGDDWILKDNGKFGSSVYAEFSFKKFKITNLYNQNLLQIL